MQNQSHYDPTRKTVGAIYKEAQENASRLPVTVGDMTNEVMSSLVEDINETVIDGTKEFEGQSFFITVHEKKDLQMKTCLLRRMIKTKYRPYPEDDTLVFHVEPASQSVTFCWCLPHHTEMDNVIDNANLYETDYVNEIRAWKRLDLFHFGFVKDQMGNWKPNPKWVDKKMEAKRGPTLILPMM